jgi:hypothetical protein
LVKQRLHYALTDGHDHPEGSLPRTKGNTVP